MNDRRFLAAVAASLAVHACALLSVEPERPPVLLLARGEICVEAIASPALAPRTPSEGKEQAHKERKPVPPVPPPPWTKVSTERAAEKPVPPRPEKAVLPAARKSVPARPVPLAKVTAKPRQEVSRAPQRVTPQPVPRPQTKVRSLPAPEPKGDRAPLPKPPRPGTPSNKPAKAPSPRKPLSTEQNPEGRHRQKLPPPTVVEKPPVTPAPATSLALPAREAKSLNKPARSPQKASLPSMPRSEGVKTQARLLGSRRPVYPREAQLQGLEGRVVISLDISAEGRVTAARIHESSGHRILDDATVRFAEDLRFVPARWGSSAVPTTVLLPVRYRLTDP